MAHGYSRVHNGYKANHESICFRPVNRKRVAKKEMMMMMGENREL